MGRISASVRKAASSFKRELFKPEIRIIKQKQQTDTSVVPDLTTIIERQPKSKSFTYGTYLQGVKQNEWLAVSLMRIADAIIFAKWKIVDKATGKPVEDQELPVVKIFKNPNSFQLYTDFTELLVWHWLTTGNAFVLSAERSPLGNPTKLFLLRPDRIKIVPDPIRFIAGYEYFTAGLTEKNAVKFMPEQITHIKFSNPTDTYWGMGKVEAAERVYNMDIASAEYGWRFFLNGAVAGTILTTEKTLAPEVRNQIMAAWDERHRGHERAHNMTLLEGGLEIKDRGMSPKEADFLETRKASREAILALFGVQPLKAGITEGSNRATAFVQERSWQRDTVMPLLRRLEAKYSAIAETFGNYAFKYEELVAEDNEIDATIAANYFKIGAITPNEIREVYAGLPRIENMPEMDKPFLPLGMLPVGSEQPLDLFGPARSQEPTGSKEPEAIIRKKQTEDEKPFPKGTPLQRRVLRATLISRGHVQFEMRRAVAKFFEAQGQRVLARFFEKSVLNSYLQTKRIDDALDISEDEKEWNRVTKIAFTAALQSSNQDMADLMGFETTLTFGPGNPDFDARLRRLSAKVTKVSDETKLRLEEVIAQGIELGLGPTAIANGNPDLEYPGIRGMFEEFSQSRSQLIARTEAARSVDAAVTAVYRGMGIETCDIIGCQDFVIMDGQRWGCNSQGIPISEAGFIEFHPNHKGAVVPRVVKATEIARMLTAIEKSAI